jgi:hypothetical protein
VRNGSSAPGVLMVQMEPPAALEEEFHRWYDTEHIPERKALPGFLSAERFVCTDGWPRYVGFYDLASLAVLESEAYRAIGGENLSPWSKRVLSRVVGLRRFELSRVDGGGAVPPQNGKLLLSFALPNTSDLLEAGEAVARELPDVGVRVFANRLPAGESTLMLDAPALGLIPDLSEGQIRAALGNLIADLVGAWRYVRYAP